MPEIKPLAADCCVADACCASASPAASTRSDTTAAGATVFRIPAMDCAVEESDIRRALDKVAGIKSLNFQLGARTVAINAPADVIPLAVKAIKAAGYEPSPVLAESKDQSTPHADDDGHDHSSHEGGTGVLRLAAALVFAIGAEALHYFAGDASGMKYVGLAIAAIAIWLSGVETYTKGIKALIRGRLNINALMSVAVTGAFVIGQWPEAAMVMALYAIAELIEARAADRARNAIKGLVALAPEEADVQQADRSWKTVPSAGVALD
ncbi:MAG: cation transporter, partial [Gammaproteobacteria bacterium]|nr:cation transporter [Gammaproteobacteria bacterium]